MIGVKEQPLEKIIINHHLDHLSHQSDNDNSMSSPKSAPPSSDITRQHTPASGSADGEAAEEEQLPEKVG